MIGSLRQLSGGLLVALIVACGGSDQPAPEETAGTGEAPEAFAGVTFAPDLGIDFSQMREVAEGLWVQDLEEGEGTAVASGSTISAHYTGWLPSGTKFDSSLDRGQPFSVQIGMGNVIQGWDQGIPGMKPGGKRRLVIAPDLAYGAQARGPIPANSTLVFDVEVLEVR